MGILLMPTPICVTIDIDLSWLIISTRLTFPMWYCVSLLSMGSVGLIKDPNMKDSPHYPNASKLAV